MYWSFSLSDQYSTTRFTTHFLLVRPRPRHHTLAHSQLLALDGVDLDLILQLALFGELRYA